MTTIEVPPTNGFSKFNQIGRRNAISIIHARGTHYEIGFDIVSSNFKFYCKKKNKK